VTGEAGETVQLLQKERSSPPRSRRRRHGLPLSHTTTAGREKQRHQRTTPPQTSTSPPRPARRKKHRSSSSSPEKRRRTRLIERCWLASTKPASTGEARRRRANPRSWIWLEQVQDNTLGRWHQATTALRRRLDLLLRAPAPPHRYPDRHRRRERRWFGPAHSGSHLGDI
jgi:hypothetical protein